MVPASRNGSLQWYLGLRVTGINDGVAAMAGDRTDTAIAVVTGEDMADRVGMAEGLYGQQKRQQQDLQRCGFSIPGDHGEKSTCFNWLSPYQRQRPVGPQSPPGLAPPAP